MAKRKIPRIPRAGKFRKGGWPRFSCYDRRWVTARVWASKMSKFISDHEVK